LINNKDDKSKAIESSVFIKTDKLNNNEIEDIHFNIKSSMTLEQIQSYALKLKINIISGATKSGKPKNKTKSELIDEIKLLLKSKND